MKRLEKIVYSTMIGIYLSYTAFGVFVCMDNDISGKRTYEVIDGNKAVITTYEGKFLVMDCEIQGDTLYIDKSMYSFIEMNDIEIVNHKYENVFVS
ncbi:MAG TPA: hypothetical protein IAB48_01850 [Candidatus Fimimorpha excrementavium]|nr:hypothetical protein [Candidatus Fimimorpha excrementavium]